MWSKYRHHLRFNSEHIWEGLYDHLKSKRIFTLISYNLYMSTTNIVCDLEVPTLVPHTLVFLSMCKDTLFLF